MGMCSGNARISTPRLPSILRGLGRKPCRRSLGCGRRALPGCGTGLWLLRAGHDTDLGSAREGEVRLWLLTQVVPSGLLLASPFVLRGTGETKGPPIRLEFRPVLGLTHCLRLIALQI